MPVETYRSDIPLNLSQKDESFRPRKTLRYCYEAFITRVREMSCEWGSSSSREDEGADRDARVVRSLAWAPFSSATGHL